MSGNDGGGMAVCKTQLGFESSTSYKASPVIPDNIPENWRAAYHDMQAADKQTAVEALQAQGYTVIMVGDGENDLLALATAHVGFGMWHPTPYGSALPTFTPMWF